MPMQAARRQAHSPQGISSKLLISLVEIAVPVKQTGGLRELPAPDEPGVH